MAKKEKKKKGKEPEAEVEKPEAAPAEGAEGEAPAKKKMSGKTLVLFIVLPALLVLGGGGAAAFMLLGGGKKAEAAEAGHGEKPADAHGEKKPDAKKKKEAKKKEEGGGHGEAAGGGAAAEADVGHALPCEEGDPCYYALPKIIVNLAGARDERAPFMELSLVLESSDAAVFEDVGEAMPRLKDTFQAFLRELRVEDLDGSTGSYRLRIELLKRFNTVMAPQKVDAVLIEGMLVQ